MNFLGIDLDRPNVEPVKRLCAGRYGWVSHRFNINGGKTGRETYFAEWMIAVADNVTANNALLKKLKGRR